MQPDDLSIPRGDNKIKEKLNLHLKKRLQETGKCSSSLAEPPPPSSSTASACPPASPAAATAGPSSGTKTKKQKTKHLSTTSTATSSSTGSSFNINAALSGGCSSSKNPEHLMLSPGALGGGNSNDTTNSSFNSVDLDADANLSNDGQERAAGEKSGSKVNSKPDIFTLVLNEKKSSLMRDPEVIKFLKDLMEKREKS